MLPDPLKQTDPTHVEWQGREWVYFGGCDYLRLAWHSRIRKTLRSGLNEAGSSVSASRLTTGNHPAYAELEGRLGRFFNSPAVTLASNGYLTNIVVAQAMSGSIDRVLLDDSAHSSLVDAARLTGVPVLRFAHLDPTDLARQLRTSKRRWLVMTDGVFAHNGAQAPLLQYLEKLRTNSLMLVDDAHGAGVLGENGRGSVEPFGIRDNRVIRTVTFSKAFGVSGGAVLSSKAIRRRILKLSGASICSTPIPPYQARAIGVAADLIEQGKVRNKLASNLGWLAQRLGVSQPQFPIITFTSASRSKVNRLRGRLMEAGIHPPLISYPGGASGGYFRFAISSAHIRAQLSALADCLRDA
jgi:7-keto-8-aminopelargonate synthetase-like enzyme